MPPGGLERDGGKFEKLDTPSTYSYAEVDIVCVGRSVHGVNLNVVRPTGQIRNVGPGESSAALQLWL